MTFSLESKSRLNTPGCCFQSDRVMTQKIPPSHIWACVYTHAQQKEAREVTHVATFVAERVHTPENTAKECRLFCL